MSLILSDDLKQRWRKANPGQRAIVWAMQATYDPLLSSEDNAKSLEIIKAKLHSDIGMVPSIDLGDIKATDAVWEWIDGKNTRALVAFVNEKHGGGLVGSIP